MAVVVASAQNPVTQLPLVLQTEEMQTASIRRGTVFKTVNADTTLTMDVYYPAGHSGTPLPVVIFVNGVGALDLPGWRGYQDWGRLTAASGMAAVLFQARPQQPKDTEDLIDFLRKNARRLSLDPERIVLWASSGNANVALPLMMQPERTYIRAGVIYYGMSGQESHRIPKRQDVPLLVVRNGFDFYHLNTNIDQFVANALERDLDIEVINYVRSKHAFDVLDDSERSRDIIRRTIAFMKFHLAERPTGITTVLTAKNLATMILKEKKTDYALSLFTAAVAARRADSLYRQYHRFFDHVVDEPNLNIIGYRLMDDRRMDEAFRVFTVNAETYPASPNAFDALADYYDRSGNTVKTLEYCRAASLLLADAQIPPQVKEAIRKSIDEKMRKHQKH